MKMIILHCCSDETWVNPKEIIAMHREPPKTLVMLEEPGGRISVDETPRQVLSLIHASEESSAGESLIYSSARRLGNQYWFKRSFK